MDTEISLNMGPLARVEGQIIGQMPGFGACDPLFRDAPSALLPFRYSTVVQRLKLGGLASGAGVAGSDLSTAASNVVQAFSYGVGEDPALNPGGTTGFPATSTSVVAQPDLTDSYKGGAPIEIGELYVVVGMCVHVQRPVELTAVTALGTGVSSYTFSAWVDEYEERIREAFLTHTWIEFLYGQNASRYRMGRPDFWPQMSGPSGNIVSNGRPTAGVFLPFRAATVINGRDQSRQLTINVSTGGYSITIANNAAQPTQNELYVPFTIQLIGFPVCARDTAALTAAQSCAPGDQNASVKAALATLKAAGLV